MKNINLFLKDQVDHHQTPSIQYAFFDTEKVIYELHHGYKNVKSQEPVLRFGNVLIFNRSGMRDERILDRADAFFIK